MGPIGAGAQVAGGDLSVPSPLASAASLDSGCPASQGRLVDGVAVLRSLPFLGATAAPTG